MAGLDSPFSEHSGYHSPEVEITICEDAPPTVLDGILMLGYAAEIGPDAMRTLLCTLLLKRPGRNNWGADNIRY